MMRSEPTSATVAFLPRTATDAPQTQSSPAFAVVLVC